MTYLSLFDKIRILFSSLLDFKGILMFSILMIILTILYVIKKLSPKRYTIAISLSLILAFLISILSNLKVLSNTFDNFTTIFFGNIYFPSIYVYISMVVIVLCAFLVSVINIKIKRVYKIINKIMFVLNNVLLVIILNIIAKNKIDIFSINSLYTNTNLVVLLEISMGLFLIWMGSLVVAYVTNCICDRVSKKKEIKILALEEQLIKSSYEDEPIVSLKENNLQEVYLHDSIVEQKNDFCDTFEEVSVEKNDIINETVNDEVIEASDDYELKDNKGITFDDILNGRVPVSYYDNDNKEYEYTISNPQEVYESNYNNVKSNELQEDDLFSEELISEIKTDENEREENTTVNSISLNDLVDSDVLDEVETIDRTKELVKENDNYTIEDYKKIIGMLNSLKKHSIDHNITVDDAVAISLISNYSIDDCLKFKDILESNLN